MTTLIKLQNAFWPFTVAFPFPGDIPFKLIEYADHARILFEVGPEPQFVFPEKDPTILLESLGGVKTVEDVKAHFKFESNIDIDLLPSKDDPFYEKLKKEGDVLATERCPLGMVVTIDLGRGGYIPGNTYTYLLLSHPLS